MTITLFKKCKNTKSDLNTLKSTIENISKEKESVLNEYTSYKNTQIKERELSSLIPDNTINSKRDELRLLSMDLNLSVNENGRVFALGDDGNPLKNQTTLDPLPLKDVINDYYSNNSHRLKTASGGAAEGDSKGGEGKQTIESFTKEMQTAGYQVNDENFVAEMTNRINSGLLDV